MVLVSAIGEIIVMAVVVFATCVYLEILQVTKAVYIVVLEIAILGLLHHTAYNATKVFLLPVVN